MSKRKERSPAVRELDCIRIVELKRARRTSEEIAQILNSDGREEADQIQAVTVRKQWGAYMRRLAEANEEDGEKLRQRAIREHEMDRAEALRGFAEFVRTGNPSAPSFLMVAHRCQLALDRLRGVQPRQEKEGSDEKDTGEAFETVEAAREYLQKAGLGGRILPYAADTRKRRKG